MDKTENPPIGDLVLPGDCIRKFKNMNGITILGPGIKRDEDLTVIHITRPGILCHKFPNIYWVDAYQKRYIPKRGDVVIGVVTKKGGENLRVDIGSSELATLSMLQFEGATKRQKPDLQVGDIVFAKLLSAHKEMEPELVCINKYFKADNLGPLPNNGFVITVGYNLVHKLLDIENPLLRYLGKMFPYELAIGMNGKVWLNSHNKSLILKLMNELNELQYLSDNEIVLKCTKNI